MPASSPNPSDMTVHLLWMNAGLSCDGDSVSLTAAQLPSVEDIVMGAMGVPDYLGWNWKSKAGLPVVCVPGCPIQPDNLAETLLYLLYQVSGQAPVIPLDENLRPTWLFGRTVHEGCDRAGGDDGVR